MKILLDYTSGCSKHPNQDARGHRGELFWVLDGATNVFEELNLFASDDVQWVVQSLNEELLNGDERTSLNDYVKSAVARVFAEAKEKCPDMDLVEMGKLPTYALICARYRNHTLEYLCLGDCSIYVSHTPERRITDERIMPYHLMVNEVKERYTDNSRMYNEQVAKMARYIKQFVNVDNGYWIGTLNQDCIDHAKYGQVEIFEGQRFLLCSDGFRPSIDEAGLVSFRDKEIFEPDSLKKLLAMQKRSEDEYRSDKGIDLSDDRTVLLVEV